jgi:signal transduction histidine kinase
MSLISCVLAFLFFIILEELIITNNLRMNQNLILREDSNLIVSTIYKGVCDKKRLRFCTVEFKDKTHNFGFKVPNINHEQSFFTSVILKTSKKKLEHYIGDIEIVVRTVPSINYLLLLLGFSFFLIFPIFLISSFIATKKELVLVDQNLKLQKSLNSISQQVAHDIKSPLAALEIVMDDLKNLPESSRELTLHAISRIQDIANNLSKNENSKKKEYKDCLPSITIANIITEKTIEYQNLKNLKITLIDKTSKCTFIKAVESELSCVISNIINNSVEEMSGEGEVKILIQQNSSSYEVKITDTGKGFPEILLKTEIERGNSIGKKGGKGLGLFSSSKIICDMGGVFDISNQISGGAQTTIKIPIISPPNWFKETLNLKDQVNVYVIDDDRSIHDVWRKVLNNSQYDINIIDLYTQEEIKKTLESIDSDSIILVDYDLRQNFTGIDYISHFSLSNAVLVTSNYDTEIVASYCNKNSVQLIPKQIVNAIKIV